MSTDVENDSKQKADSNSEAKSFELLTEIYNIARNNSEQINDIKNIVDLLAVEQKNFEVQMQKQLDIVKSEISALKSDLGGINEDQSILKSQIEALERSNDELVKNLKVMDDASKTDQQLCGKIVTDIIESNERFIDNVIRLLKVHSILEQTELMCDIAEKSNVPSKKPSSVSADEWKALYRKKGGGSSISDEYIKELWKDSLN